MSDRSTRSSTMSGDGQHDEQDATMRALSVALQHHAALISEQNIICRLLQVSKRCRAAVQQSVAAATDVRVTAVPKPQVSDMVVVTQLANFASWLPKHAGLLRSISIHCAEEYVGMARPMLEHSLQLAGAAMPAMPGTPAGPGPGPTEVQAAGPEAVRAPLCLERFSSDLVTSPGILSALPAATLTQLQLRLLGMAPTEMSEITTLAGPLSSLTALQQLEIFSLSYPTSLPASYVSAVGRLNRLTQLQLDGLSRDSDLLQLPVQLQRLKLTFSWNLDPAGGCSVDLRHLTRLQQLELDVAMQVQAHGSGLPAQLQQLQLHCNWGSAIEQLGKSSLQHLQQLTLTAPGDGLQQLQSLAALPRLQQLSVLYENVGFEHLDSIRRATPAWGQLPQLCSLKMVEVYLEPDTAIELFRQIGAATSLTKLELFDFFVLGPGPDELDGDEELPPRIALCEHLSRLTRLQELQLVSQYVSEIDYVLEQQDAQHLTTLTALTKLDLGRAAGCVDDAVAAALAIELPRLQWLSVCGLSSAAALPGIGKLRGLGHLAVGDDCGCALPARIARQGLKYLTQLSQLTHLGGFKACGAEALAGFWAAVRGQGRQQ